MGLSQRVVAAGVLVAAQVLGVAGANEAGSLEDVKHIVIFMQENRAFDHYYGTMKGVRGFNDRAAPRLPNGDNVFYQPVKRQPNGTQLCGCIECDIEWVGRGGQLAYDLTTAPCPELVRQFGEANPSIKIHDGQLCSALLDQFQHASIQHLRISDYIKSFTCPATLQVSGTSESAPTPPDEKYNGTYMLPFPLHFNATAASCMPAPAMGFTVDTAMRNNGSMNAWNYARDPGYGMSYFARTDLPFYFNLADSFLVGDQYFQSTLTQTNPNRFHLFSGSNGLSVNGSGKCLLDDHEPASGIKWETYAESLEKAGVSWKVYQEQDNFDDNGFAWFDSFKAAQPGSPLYEKGMKRSEDVVAEFARDVAADSLPQVSWIVGPTKLSEHAENHPADGEDLTARLVRVLADPKNAHVYAKTAFILNYDEGGQFFDHHWTPSPPVNEKDGKSTESVIGELTLDVEGSVPPGNPIGLGFRVPLMIISPWTRGGHVYSEITDHTSVIKFVEQRFGVRCPNISPWRRAVVGDLTAAFDWEHPDYSWPSMPNTSANVERSSWQCHHLPTPEVPVVQSMPTQEPGTKPSRALPYAFHVDTSVSASQATMRMASLGSGTLSMYVYDRYRSSTAPRKYTVAGGKALEDVWPLAADGTFDLSAHGPNGFVRQVSGSGGAHSSVAVKLRYDKSEQHVVLLVEVDKAGPCSRVTVTDNAYSTPGLPAVLEGARKLPVSVAHSGNWYDLSVVAACASGHSASWRFMGRMETGKHTTTDPAMGQPTLGQAGADAAAHSRSHPPMPWIQRRFSAASACSSRRGSHKDICAAHVEFPWPGTQVEQETALVV